MPEIDNADGAVSATEQAEKRTEETHRLVVVTLSRAGQSHPAKRCHAPFVCLHTMTTPLSAIL